MLGFFVGRFIPKKLTFETEKPNFFESWEERILTDGRVWILWRKFFAALESVGLAVKTHDYVSTEAEN